MDDAQAIPVLKELTAHTKGQYKDPFKYIDEKMMVTPRSMAKTLAKPGPMAEGDHYLLPFYERYWNKIHFG